MNSGHASTDEACVNQLECIMELLQKEMEERHSTSNAGKAFRIRRHDSGRSVVAFGICRNKKCQSVGGPIKKMIPVYVLLLAILCVFVFELREFKGMRTELAGIRREQLKDPHGGPPGPGPYCCSAHYWRTTGV